jgi:hypothetical protein
VKNLSLLLTLFVLAGCATQHPRGVSRVDEFDSVKVDQMVGNNVAAAPLQKVILCLNGRRESRLVNAVTNVMVRSLTNAVVQAVTNVTVSASTNYLVTGMTNIAPVLGATGGPLTDEATAAAVATVTETPATAPQTNLNTGPLLSTNVTASLARNNSATAGPNQRVANNQLIRTYNNQITTASNNLSISLVTNLVVTMETNAVVGYLTNYLVTSLTNTSVLPTNYFAADYFLYTELIPPPEFTLQPSGESLVLLVDGVRYGLVTAPSGTSFVARRGFTSTLYRASPELLVAIANAREVRVRLRGTTGALERTMSDRSRSNFKAFLVRYFAPEIPENPEPPGATGTNTAASIPETEPAAPVPPVTLVTPSGS